MRQPSLIKIFIIVTLGSIMFLLISSGFLVPFKINSQYTISTSSALLLFEMEIPFLKAEVVQAHQQNEWMYENKNTWWDFVSLYTPKHPNDWLKQEIPVFAYINEGEMEPIGDEEDYPIELSPPQGFFQEGKNQKSETTEIQDQEKDNAIKEQINKKVVFIYHTHNRESFLPEIKSTKANEAYDPTINITLVGKKLSEELKLLGIDSIFSSKDYWPELEKYSMSYKHSLKTVQTALQQNKDFQFIFDIHRDSHPKKITTRRIDGKDYAAIYFIIGTGNKNYERNYEFAKKINDTLEKLYPGISRGIYIKEKAHGINGEYNQSVSPNSVTIEIGGVDNTLEEEYRTAKALADAIAEIYWEAVKVDVKPQNE